jgi:hypothetical protein
VTLIFEAVGIVVLAAAVRAVLPASRLSLTTAILALAVAIGGAPFWLEGYAASRRLLDEHSANEALTRGQANAAGGGIFPADEGFLAWVDARLPRNARIYMECTGHCPAEWVTFRLSPRVFVNSPREAQYALFYDVSPGSKAYARGKPTAIFAPADTSGDAFFAAGQEAVVTLRP